MNSSLIKADPAYRKKVILLLVVLTVLGAGVVIYFQNLMNTLLASAETDPRGTIEDTIQIFRILMAALGISLFGMGAYFMWVSVRILRSSQFPPPQTKVIRNIRAVIGRPAMIRGVFGLFMSLVIMGAGVAAPWIAYTHFEAAMAEMAADLDSSRPPPTSFPENRPPIQEK
jgi:MFS family permease